MSPSLWPARFGCLTLMLGIPTLALAVDGTITINGEITASTCKINGGDPPADILVTLPKISTSALETKGSHAGATLFTIALTDCPATLVGEVRAHFEPGVTTDYANGALYAYTTTSDKTKATGIPANQGTQDKAENIVIQLTNSDGSPISIGAADSKTKGVMFGEASEGKKQATLHYLARYLKSTDNAVSAGKLYTYVNYSIAYP